MFGRLFGVVTATVLAMSSLGYASTIEFLHGEVHREEFRVNMGDQVVATGDLRIVSIEEAVIEGLLLAEPGVTIEVVAPSIVVRGTIRAGDAHHEREVLKSGTRGGDLILEAPFILLDGARLRAGSGGNAGPAGHGGHGGDVVIRAFKILSEGAIAHGGIAGEAGAGVHGFGEEAMSGGNGGNGGGMIAIQLPDPEVPPPSWAAPRAVNPLRVCRVANHVNAADEETGADAHADEDAGLAEKGNGPLRLQQEGTLTRRSWVWQQWSIGLKWIKEQTAR